MSSLPEDLYLDILLRVPVKTTFVCKCVCKSWFSLISDPYFDMKHLNDTTQAKKSRLMIKSYDKLSFYSVSYDSLLSSNESDNAAAVVEMDYPYKSSSVMELFGSCSLSSSNESDNAAVVEMDYPYISSSVIQLFGSCNGLLYGWNDPMNFFFLWNPATGEYKRLPKSPDTFFNKYPGASHGFGYDHKTDDYKLVNIYRSIEHIIIQVYSLKSNSWKSCPSVRYDFTRQGSGVLLNGALHWFGSIIGKASSTMIVSMDIGEERFEELQLPIKQYSLKMGMLEERLCVLAPVKETVEELIPIELVSFEVWVMQDYGVPDSWTKLYKITTESLMFGSPSDKEFIGSLKDGKILFTNRTRDLILYDPKTKCGTPRKPNSRGSKVLNGAVSYFESLVSLNSVTAVGRRKKREPTRILGKISKTKKRNRSVSKLKGD